MSQGQGHAAEPLIHSKQSPAEFVLLAVANNELVMDCDGFYKWWPTDAVAGEALTAEKLRAIAEWLDKDNRTLGARVCQSVMESRTQEELAS